MRLRRRSPSSLEDKHHSWSLQLHLIKQQYSIVSLQTSQSCGSGYAVDIQALMRAAAFIFRMLTAIHALGLFFSKSMVVSFLLFFQS